MFNRSYLFDIGAPKERKALGSRDSRLKQSLIAQIWEKPAYLAIPSKPLGAPILMIVVTSISVSGHPIVCECESKWRKDFSEMQGYMCKMQKKKKFPNTRGIKKNAKIILPLKDIRADFSIYYQT